MGLIHHIERTIKINHGREIENLGKHFSFKTSHDISEKKNLNWIGMLLSRIFLGAFVTLMQSK